jgi:hypothetical protein
MLPGPKRSQYPDRKAQKKRDVAAPA